MQCMLSLMTHYFNRFTVVTRYTLCTAWLCCLAVPAAEPAAQTLPLNQRPEWLRKEGLIMAGSWEPLTYRTRQGATGGHVPTAEERAAWEYEHGAEVTGQLKALGVNFIMMHCYKGAGLEVEKETMQDAVRFARQYREAGLHVGVYVYSGAFLWEPMFREVPEAQNWVLLDKNYKPCDYYNMGIRYFWNRNHPGAQAFYKNIIKFAVNDIQADMLHFDNHSEPVGRDAWSIAQFREYLRKTFSYEQLQQMGAADLSQVVPPMGTQLAIHTWTVPIMDEPPRTLLDYAWQDFASQQLAGAYREMGRYARSLRSDILLELNTGGPAHKLEAPKDFGRILPVGEALWSEGGPSGYNNGYYQTRIRSYKISRNMGNLVFFYASTPLSMAESMAFNSDCLGCIAHFTDGKIEPSRPTDGLPFEAVRPYIDFYRTRRNLLRDANVVADVAVLRSFPSQVFADPRHAALTSRVEQLCLDQRIPFQMVHEHQLADLQGYRTLVLAGCIALSDVQVERIISFTAQGGRLCIIGPVSHYNEWMMPRDGAPLDRIPADRVVQIDADGNIAEALRQAAGGQFSAGVTGEEGLFVEYTKTPAGRLVHLVNFQPERPVHNVQVRMLIPEGQRVKRVLLASPEHKADLPVKFRKQDGEITFTVPSVGTYEIAVVEM